jgi:hypothetical protein
VAESVILNKYRQHGTIYFLMCVLYVSIQNFHMSSSSASLIIVIKSQNKYKFHVTIMKLFYIFICFRTFQDSALSGANITIIMEICLPTLFVYWCQDTIL